MAINPETQYPGKIEASSPAFPYGKAQNITVPGDGSGTPWEAAIVNDVLGFQQSLLSRAGIVSSGSPDEVGASQYLESLLQSVGSVHDSVVSMIADDTLVPGVLIRTTSYYAGWAATTVGPRGGALRVIVTQAEHDIVRETATVNETGDITLTNGNVALLIFDGRVQVTQFGAKGDDLAIDHQPIIDAVAFAQDISQIGSTTVWFDTGKYICDENIFVTTSGKASVVLRGAGKHASVLKAGSNLAAATKPTMNGTYAPVLAYNPIMAWDVTTGCEIHDLGFDGNNEDVYGLYVNESFFVNFTRMRITGCNQRPFTGIRVQVGTFLDPVFILNGQGGGAFDGSVLFYDTSALTFTSPNLERTGTDRYAVEFFQPNNKGGWNIISPWFETETLAGGDIPALGFMSVGGRNGEVSTSYQTYADHPDGGELLVDYKASTDTITRDGIVMTTLAALDWEVELNDVSGITRGVEAAVDSFGNKTRGGFDAAKVVNNAAASNGNSFSPLAFADGSAYPNVSGGFRVSRPATAGGQPIGTNDYIALFEDLVLKLFTNANNRLELIAGNLNLKSNLAMTLEANGGSSNLNLSAQNYLFAGASGATGYQRPIWFGSYTLWVDSTGDLRIKSGAPASDLDGSVVGTQT